MGPKFLVIGAGSRGNAYARAVTTSTNGSIYAVAEPDPYKRRFFGREYIWGNEAPKPGQEFSDWREWITYYTSTPRPSNGTTTTTSSGNRNRNGNGNDNEDNPSTIDGIFICTLDDTHLPILLAISALPCPPQGILCEKPLALSLQDCLSIYAAYRDTHTIFSIGHVLRYSPHNILLRTLLQEEKVIGEITSIEHAEPIGNWHFAHSYVRGNWRRETGAGDGSLLTKSCHDVDFVLWVVESSSTLASSGDGEGKGSSSSSSSSSSRRRKEMRSISSTGHLTQFRKSRKPAAAGTATNCLSCDYEPECVYSSLRVYRDMHLRKGETGWPVNIVCPDIEDIGASSHSNGEGRGLKEEEEEREKYLIAKLGEDYDEKEMSDGDIAARTWYGRCVYEADNNVCDDQVVTMTWSDIEENGDSDGKGKQGGVTAVFHMIAPTEKQCERRGRVYGTHGELEYDSRTIRYFSFETRETTVIQVPKRPPEEEKAHGGGDYGLARGFVAAVEKVVEEGWDAGKAQREFVGCTLEDVVRSHAVVFAAEEARREEKIVKWKEWWEGKLSTLS